MLFAKFHSQLPRIVSRNVQIANFYNKTPKPAVNDRVIIEAGKRNLKQSPWKINLIARLIRGTWLPDALAQLKFSPKHRCEDVAQLVQRASHMAKLTHEAMPEELLVREVVVTKGSSQKRPRIMGRGRTGLGYKRWTHVMVRVEKVDFVRETTEARNPIQLKRWQTLQKIVEKKKNLVPPPAPKVDENGQTVATGNNSA